MKILLVNKYHYNKGGAERAYFETAKILEKNGHEVAFFSMHDNNNLKSKWSRFFISNIDYNKKEASLFDKFFYSFKMFYNFEAARKFQGIIDEFKPDLIHYHNIYHQLSPSIVRVAKKNGIPQVMTLHDYKLICPDYNLLNKGLIWEDTKAHKYYKCIFSKCVKNSYLKSILAVLESYWQYFTGAYSAIDVFISPSKFLINKFREFDFIGDIEFLPNSFAIDDLPKFKEDSKRDYILYFGRLSQEKGLNNLLDAYAAADLSKDLYVVGSGPQEDELKSIVIKLGLSSRVKFLGYKSGYGLFDLIYNSSFVVVPSLWYENAPYSIVESMALGKIVLASRLGGLPDMINDKQNGFLFDFNNMEELVNKMIFINKINRDTIKELEANAKKFVLENNSPEKYYEKLSKIYEKIINS